MYRFIDFNDEKVDSMLAMELADLTKTLARDPDYETEIRSHSYVDMEEKIVYVSHFWSHRPDGETKGGMKSDVFLRAMGNLQYTDRAAAMRFRDWSRKQAHPSFAIQLFVLLEDLRIEELCKRARPGMRAEFSVRRKIYQSYFANQLKVNLQKSVFTDALFNFIYTLLNASSPIYDVPSFPEELGRIVPSIRERLELAFSAGSTEETAQISRQIYDIAGESLGRDMLNEYFHLGNMSASEEKGVEYRDLLRKDPLANCDIADEEPEEAEVFKEEMKTWHRETKDPGESFLQFDLEQGTGTKIFNKDAREGEAGDQALAMVQGSAQKSANKDFSDLEAMEGKKDIPAGGTPKYGHENKRARAVFRTDFQVSEKDRVQYKEDQASITLYQKKLKNIMHRTLEHKNIEPRSGLLFGRLNKRKLLHYFTEEQPKLFYKKQEPSKEIDAVFTLLVDCSASMQDKMEETKRGIVLFHEALKSVKVHHEIVGFWEDANEASAEDQPNYFSIPISFSNCLKEQAGPEIMKLQPEEDNRDGFAIRVMGERLARRHEKQKFMIVFSDGEPAAFGYSQNGIIDTHEAVVDARRQGIEIFNIFLSNDEIGEEQKKVFQNIYGQYSIIVPSVDKLPDLLFPLLKKLLAQAI